LTLDRCQNWSRPSEEPKMEKKAGLEKKEKGKAKAHSKVGSETFPLRGR